MTIITVIILIVFNIIISQVTTSLSPVTALSECKAVINKFGK